MTSHSISVIEIHQISFSTSWEPKHQNQLKTYGYQNGEWGYSFMLILCHAVLLILAKNCFFAKSLFYPQSHCVHMPHHHCCKNICWTIKTRYEVLFSSTAKFELKAGNICDKFIMNANQNGSLGSDRLSKYESIGGLEGAKYGLFHWAVLQLLANSLYWSK